MHLTGEVIGHRDGYLGAASGAMGSRETTASTSGISRSVSVAALGVTARRRADYKGWMAPIVFTPVMSMP